MPASPPPAPSDKSDRSFFYRSSDAPAKASSPRPGSAELRPGARVAHFVLREFIARGGMGQVWVAEDTELRRTVALKLVLPELLDTRAVDFFAREARAGGRLAHPNIVTTLASGRDEGLAWIAQELVEGSWTLKDFIESVRSEDVVPEGYYRNVADLVAQVADALAAAHAAGVIHRDVKPANILITIDDRPKLTDFGLARVSDESVLSMTGEVAGSWAYMSPEQVAANRSAIDHRTDIFSLGVVLYELLALRRPFDGDTAQQIAEQIAKFEPPEASKVRSQCPRELGVICGKALEKSQGSRYDTAAALAADLRAHLANRPIVAQAPNALARAVKWSRRNPTPAAVTAVSLAALVIVSILLAINARQAEENAGLADHNATLAADADRERDDVLRLAAAQDLEDLVAEQAELWPPHPENLGAFRDWLARANTLVADLPLHRAKRDELRALARIRTDEDERARRDARQAALESELAVRRQALAVRRDEAELPVHVLDRSALPDDPLEWNAVAWSLVTPRRTVLGQEPRGVAIAEAVVDDSTGAYRAALLETIAWGRLAIGDDVGAREASLAARDAAPDIQRGELTKHVELIESGIASRSSAAGLAAEEVALAALEAEIDELRTGTDRVTLEFPAESEQARWWLNQLTDLIGDLEAAERELIAPDATSAAYGWSVGKRLRFAARLEAGHAPGGDLDVAWQRALPAIRSAYPGLELEAQLGLVPLGPDPDSGLWEFAHLATGEPPERGASGSLVLTEESAVVLVLVPDGECWMGAQPLDPAARNYDPEAYEDEFPVHRVSLSAWFVSKYEMTQGQWLRTTGDNPSHNKWPSRLVTTLLNPVEQVSWNAAVQSLGRLGLDLPTEAQWEQAARAGTDTPWSFGATREELQGLINIADKTASDDGAVWPAIVLWPDHEDGGIIHMPVGHYPANAFGLHELHGNVAEWCLDEFDHAFYARTPTRDPVAPKHGFDVRVFRGGSFDLGATNARSSMRNFGWENQPDYTIGIRPARGIENAER
ncbi:bifunctional serine/threonine-protein kinase/formylglycine-generating enzyme family protein [Engelhardtia mirabilis]|uniref:non-specific serine/threonine protein kinase n=1 Tax=Engelhardtia mirabilis TaxID=2528011 RepID=A0A518BGS7_9BACT|nr:Serine/threonine-protein kinase PrkC [Planctomycetes bacterium Pla133]QDV00508.1 Serine/threonine-protein kinase PrkC [Planctomycetes bacterium Pla86]